MYVINVVVHHKVTNEYVAYKPHVLQRRTAIYEVCPSLYAPLPPPLCLQCSGGRDHWPETLTLNP